jgi:hypothetical protein
VPERLANTVFAWAAEVCPVAGPLKRERRKFQAEEGVLIMLALTPRGFQFPEREHSSRAGDCRSRFR